MKNHPLPIQTFTLRGAALIAVVPQVTFFLGGAFLTIFGVSAPWGIATIASCLWWLVAMWVGFVHRGPATKRVVQLVMWGYFPLLIVSRFIWMGIVAYCS